MSTHNIGYVFYEDLIEIIFQLSSNIIKCNLISLCGILLLLIFLCVNIIDYIQCLGLYIIPFVIF